MPLQTPLTNSLRTPAIAAFGAKIKGPYPWLASSGVLPAGSTFTRASNGSFINTSGNRATAGTNQPRFTNVGGQQYLLMEPNATNQIQSYAYNPTYWGTSAGMTATQDGTLSSDGATQAHKIERIGGSGFANALPNVFPMTAGQHVFCYMDVKRGSRDFVGLAIAQDLTGKLVRGDFNLVARTFTLYQNVGSMTWGGATVTDTGNGYLRCGFWLLPDATTTTGRMLLYPNNIGNSADGFFYLSGAQAESGQVGTSAIVTTAGIETRAEDFQALKLPLPTGNSVKFTFSDDTTQTLTGIADLSPIGGSSLTKRLIKKIEVV